MSVPGIRVEAGKYYESDDWSKKVGTGNAESIKMKGLHRLVMKIC